MSRKLSLFLHFNLYYPPLLSSPFPTVAPQVIPPSFLSWHKCVSAPPGQGERGEGKRSKKKIHGKTRETRVSGSWFFFAWQGPGVTKEQKKNDFSPNGEKCLLWVPCGLKLTPPPPAPLRMKVCSKSRGKGKGGG